MTRFNEKSEGIKTSNQAGGFAYKQGRGNELISILLTSFAKDDYYGTADDRFERMKNLINSGDPSFHLFAAKAAIYARNVIGMRSITHVMASLLADKINGLDWGKSFYNAIIRRPDDMTEIISYHIGRGQKVTAAMKKGFALAFQKFDRYQLAKYRGEGKSVKLIDVVRMVHPKYNESTNDLVKGILVSEGTWESELTRIGQMDVTDEEKAIFKQQFWAKIISDKKLGYFALLRNLRNIYEQAPIVIPDALKQLTDERLIKNSLVMPFRFLTAYDEFLSMPQDRLIRDIITGLNKAATISLNNVPKFDGNTLVCIDTSQSMKIKNHSPVLSRIASLLGGSLARQSNADIMVFDDHARWFGYNPEDPILTLANSIDPKGGSTNTSDIFALANNRYDRIIILSDMQAWVNNNSHYSTADAARDYNRKFNADPYIYSIDLAGDGTTLFSTNKLIQIAGWSEKVFDLMRYAETNPKVMIDVVNAIEF